jgi:Zn-finger nucleic acid-binding protein
MICPRDGTELQKVELAGVELDKCHQCDGLWFDPGELEQLRDAQLSEAEEQIEREYGNPEVTRGEVDGYMRCPRCDDGRLQQITYTYTNRVRIDRCENCLGFWLDDKELDAIIGKKWQSQDKQAPSRLRALLKSMTGR